MILVKTIIPLQLQLKFLSKYLKSIRMYFQYCLDFGEDDEICTFVQAWKPCNKVFLDSLTVCLDFFPAFVSEAEGNKHLRGGGGCRYVGQERWCWSVFSACGLLLIPPLLGLLLSDQQRGSQTFPQQLTDPTRLLLSIFDCRYTRTQPRGKNQ